MWRAQTDDNGYGKLAYRTGGKRSYMKAHRLAASLAGMDIGLLICHRCDNPPCCNSAHLFVGTAQDNHADMMNKGRGPDEQAKSDAKTKVATPEIVRSVREARARGEDYWKIAADHGIGRQYASRLARGVQRKRIDGAEPVMVRRRVNTSGPRSPAHAAALAARPGRT